MDVPLALVVADVVGYFSCMDSITGRLAQTFPERWNGLEKLIDKVVGIALKG